MTGYAEFPHYGTIPDRDTDPSPPPEDDGSELHPLTLDGAREAIAVLREREREHIETIRRLETELATLRARVG